MLRVNNLQQFFVDKLNDLDTRDITRAYIVSILSKYQKSDFDFSNQSLTLMYGQAKQCNDFFLFQNLGDWIFVAETIFDNHLQDAPKDYYHCLAQNSYFKCYKIVKLDVYCQLADEFDILLERTRQLFNDAEFVPVKS